MPRAGSKTAVPYDPDVDLARATELAAELRRLNAERDETAKERVEVIRRLRENGVTVKRIADAMGVTEGAVQATLRVER